MHTDWAISVSVVVKILERRMKGLCLVLLFGAAVQGQMLLSSPEFQAFGSIPGKYGCDVVYRNNYESPSFPLEWRRVPAKTQSFVLLVDDMSDNGKVHWFVKDIPRDVSSLR